MLDCKRAAGRIAVAAVAGPCGNASPDPMRNGTRIIIWLALGLAAGGCASTATPPEARRKELADVALVAPRIAPGAYHAPDATQSPDMASKVPRFTGGGLLPVLLGAAIDAHVTAEQQAAFDASHAPLLPLVNERARALSTEDIGRAISEGVQRCRYLKAIATARSKNVLTGTVVRYGLVRRYDSLAGEAELSAEVWLDLTITRSDGTVLLDRKFSGTSDAAYSTKALHDAPERIGQLYREALESLTGVVGYHLALRYDGSDGPAPPRRPPA